jgi:hypothetical protein
MDAASTTLLAGSVVVIGRWVDNKPVSARVVIGIMGAALGVTLISEANAQLGNAFAALLLVAVTFTYALPILQKVGLAPKK